jgi:hypothetical protein
MRRGLGSHRLHQVDAFPSSGLAILRAYKANNLSTPLYSSHQAGLGKLM